MASAAQIETIDQLTTILSPEIEQVTFFGVQDDEAAHAIYPASGMNRTRARITESGAVLTIEDLLNPGATWAPVPHSDPRWDAITAHGITVEAKG